MNDYTGPNAWICWLCGDKITRLDHPYALRMTMTNLYKDRESPTTSWEEAYAHAECVVDRKLRIGFDAKSLADDLPPMPMGIPLDGTVVG